MGKLNKKQRREIIETIEKTPGGEMLVSLNYELFQRLKQIRYFIENYDQENALENIKHTLKELNI